LLVWANHIAMWRERTRPHVVASNIVMSRRAVVARRTRSRRAGRASANVARHANGSLTARASATESTAKDRLWPNARVGFEALDDLARDDMAKHAFDVAQEAHLVDADE
jgi:hypothetical protein